MNLILFHRKGDLVAAIIFKNATIKIHTEAGFLFDSVSF
jgi:hypothetical protein